MYYSTEINHFLHNVVDFIFDRFALLFTLLHFIVKPIAALLFSKIGVEFNGSNAWDIKVNDNRFYGVLGARGCTGFFEAFMEAYIDCEDLEECFMKIILAPPLFYHMERYHPYRLLKYFINTYFDALTPETMQKTLNSHYEDHADVFTYALDSTRNYSTILLYDLKEIEDATPKEVERLIDDAVFRTREHVAKKLKLEPGMKVLDIGCGYGGLAKHLADGYKVHVTGVTISKAMAEHAEEVCKGLPVKILLQDYREVTGEFDRIVSIEMFDHVGEIHHRDFFKKVNSLLTEDGIFLLQAHHWGPDYIMSYSPMLERSLHMYCYFPRFEEVALQSKGLLIVDNVENIGYCVGVQIKAFVKVMKEKKEEILEKWPEKDVRRGYLYSCLLQAIGLTGKDCVYQYVFSKNGFRYAYRY